MKNEDISPPEPVFKEYNLNQDRRIEPATTGDIELGPLKMLPGTWANIRMNDRRVDALNVLDNGAR